MQRKYLIISTIAVLLSFAGGFLVANAINRGELDRSKGELERLKAANTSDRSDLTPEEIDQKIAEADRDPSNIKYQKDLGTAFYRYAAMRQDTNILAKAVKLLERAAAAQPDDRDLQVTLGNAYFDLGYFGQDKSAFERARPFYRRALAIGPADAEVRTDLGLTFFLADPPDASQAIAEFQTALKTDPRNEKALEFLTQAYLKQNDRAAATATLEKLKSINPTSATAVELSKLIADGPPSTK